MKRRSNPTEPRSIESFLPADTPDYMLPAWLGCISWALQEPGVVAAFRAETGHHWQPGTTPLEHMIDEATADSPRAFIEAFILWVNANVWGPMDGPKKEPR